MKKIIIFLTFIISLLPNMSALAGGVQCQINNTCPGDLLKIPVGSFCIKQNGRIQGYIIRPDGNVFLIDNLAGMPNPNLLYRAMVTNERTFLIVTVNRITGQMQSQSAPFYVLSEQNISNGNITFTKNQCKL